jgi:CRISPR-associated protein Cas2
VADDRRRYQVSKALERFGKRIQYSVFELSIALKELHKLVDQMNSLLDNKLDRLLVIRLCPGCHAGIARYGANSSYEPEHTLII